MGKPTVYPKRGRTDGPYYTDGTGTVYRLKSGRDAIRECRCSNCLIVKSLWEKVNVGVTTLPGVPVVVKRKVPSTGVWSKVLPGKPGWYWFCVSGSRVDAERVPFIVEVRTYAGQLAVGNSPIAGHSFYEDGEWAGPIKLPKEPGSW